MAHAIMCPQCNAPLAPHPFARSVVCSYCGATVQLDETTVSAARFHETFRAWNSPAAYQVSSRVSIGDRHWALERLLANGRISDVYAARRARWPTELVVLKVLRDRQDIDEFENEWKVLQALQQSKAPGASTFTTLLPQPVLHGNVTEGTFAGQCVTIFRRMHGFRFTLAEVIRAYPQGIPPRASIWVWRRILEVLAFVHASGMGHGAILPEHLLVQENEHGVRLVGYSYAGLLGQSLPATASTGEPFYPRQSPSPPARTIELDLAMSARCMAAALGGDPATAILPAQVPAKLAGVIQRVARSPSPGLAGQNAWVLREELGEVAKEVFGPPQFIPIVMSH